MNYLPNTHHWSPGATVIHDADTKRPEMLMVVVGYDRSGACETRYLHPDYLPGMRKRYVNDIRFLHDPRQFGL